MEPMGALEAPLKPVSSPPHARGGGGAGTGSGPGARPQSRTTPTVAVPTLNLSRASSAMVGGEGDGGGAAGLDVLIPVVNKLQVTFRRVGGMPCGRGPSVQDGDRVSSVFLLGGCAQAGLGWAGLGSDGRVARGWELVPCSARHVLH